LAACPRPHDQGFAEPLADGGSGIDLCKTELGKGGVDAGTGNAKPWLSVTDPSTDRFSLRIDALALPRTARVRSEAIRLPKAALSLLMPSTPADSNTSRL
jgi:hypothetical protein